jgi:CDP-diacylglycerol pyrophosphatase
MNTGPSPDIKRSAVGCRLVVFWRLAVVTTMIAWAPFLLLPADATQRELPPDTLWEIVHNVCVPGQSEHHDPMPCLQVDLSGGIESGFAILRDPRGGTQFLLVPTTRISGIESPIVRGPGALNYFARAWEARTFISEALHRLLPRDYVGLAINSATSRSQDQLHIHFSCIRTDVFESLHKNEARIGNHWAPFNIPAFRHRYTAMWVAGEQLSQNNPFSFLAEGLSGPTADMANRTLVVIGFTRADGTKGFVFLAGHINQRSGDSASGEQLLDNGCTIATMGNGTIPRK